MGLSAAEKNRRKRERKKKEKEERRKRELAEKEAKEALLLSKNGEEDKPEEEEIEIEYVSEDLSKILNKQTKASEGPPPKTTASIDGLPPPAGSGSESEADKKDAENSIEDVLRRFHERAAVVPSASESKEEGDEKDAKGDQSSVVSDDYTSDEDEDEPKMSKRKLREMIRPTVAELKRRVQRPDLVEAHDVTAADPDFLIALKGIPHSTPVPFHWGRKRKYLQGKRGVDKLPFQLPDFIVKTGITDVRDTAMEDEANQSAKQRNRGRVNPKMGNMDVDYKVLYDAFFKYQTKPKNLTSWGDLYYEGKEMENSTDIKPGGPFSRALRIALGMGSGDDDNTPPPWLWNMQRYGPPPGHPKLKIPGLNAPLPNHKCQYGYHPGGWGKPPLDAYGRPLYGGNPLDPPGSSDNNTNDQRELVTSDGKTVLKSDWGGLPVGEDYVPEAENDAEESDSDMEDSSSDEESESGEDMEESEDDEGNENTGTESVLPPPPPPPQPPSGTIGDLRKEPSGNETPAPPPKQLYQVLETGAKAQGAPSVGIFQSDVRYVVPGAAAQVPEGAESVLSKAILPNPNEEGSSSSRKRRKHNDDDEDELEKNFKF